MIFLSSLDRRLDNNNARELLFRGIDREAGRFFNGGWMERENVETNASIK